MRSGSNPSETPGRRPRRAAGQEAGEHQQRHRGRQLPRHERIAQQPPATAGARDANGAVQVAHQVRPRGAERRHQTRQHAGSRRQRRREQECARVERKRQGDGNRTDGRLHRGEHAQQAPRQGQARRGAERRQHQALRQQLPDETSPAGADGEPHADLPASRHAAGKQHAHDVGARHEQDDTDHQHQAGGAHPHRAGHRRRQPHVVRRGQRHLPIRVRLRVRGGEVRHDHVQARFCLGERDVVAKPSLDEHPALPAALEPRLARGGHERRDADRRHVVHPRHRRPQVRARYRRHAEEPGRRHADHDVRLRPDTEYPSHHGRIPSEGSRPQPAGDHGHAGGAGPVVLRRQQPAEHRLNAEKPKVVAGHRFAHHEVDVLVHPHHREHRRVRRHVREHVVLRAQIEVVGIGARRVAIVGVAGIDVDELRGTNQWQRAEQDRVDDREERRVEADRHGQRHDHRDGEARIPARAAQRVPEVAEQGPPAAARRARPGPPREWRRRRPDADAPAGTLLPGDIPSRSFFSASIATWKRSSSAVSSSSRPRRNRLRRRESTPAASLTRCLRRRSFCSSECKAATACSDCQKKIE